MALIKCPECGREISDKAVSCPGCGCQVESVHEKSEYDIIVEEIYLKHMSGDKVTCTNRANAIKELRKRTGVSKKVATDSLYIRAYGKTDSQVRQEFKERRKEENRQINAQIAQNLNAIQNAFGGSKVAKCPKCHSTSIAYDTKKLSVGRAIVGNAVAGAPGAVIGGLSSKKGYAVCLNCGKRWKI